MFTLFALITLLGRGAVHGDNIRIGVILREGDEVSEKIIDNVFWRVLSNGPQHISYSSIKERVSEENAFHYHKAVCRLLNKGVGVFLTPTNGSYLPILLSYSNDYNISLVSPALFETPDDPKAPDLIPDFAVGIRPSTTRATLDLVRDFWWKEIVYIYDYDYGPEKLQIVFRVGYSTLRFKVIGMSKVREANEAVEFLRSLDDPRKQRTFNVILDTSSELARDILQQLVHHTGVRRKNYHFLLTEPTLENFWTHHEFGALKVTGFLALPPDNNRVNNEKEEWMKLLGHQTVNGEPTLMISNYYFHDAALFVSKAIWGLWRRNIDYRPGGPTPGREISSPAATTDCFQGSTDGRLSPILKKIKVDDGLTGKIEFFEVKGNRKNINLTIVQSTSAGFKKYGSWSDMGYFGGIRKVGASKLRKPEALPLTSEKQKLRVTTVISPPYMMWKEGENLVGNDRFEGYCKDMVDTLCEMVSVECEYKLSEDGKYGRIDPQTQRWSGMMGELLQNKSDLAVCDLTITGQRKRVVDFTDPFDTVSLSIIMKNPDAIRPTSSMFFVFAAFTPGVWVCILLSVILFSALFQLVTKFTGAPDSIESASGIWGRKNGIIMNVWFVVGSSMMQGTGVYPRSISSRFLTGSWWFLTSMLTCLFIASMTTQLRMKDVAGEESPQFMQLKSLSLESILSESLTNGWPQIGIVGGTSADRFIRKSTLPLYQRFAKYLEDNPGVKVQDREKGMRRVQESNGNYMLMMVSTFSDYWIRRKPCDLLNAHDTYTYAGYGLAFSPLLGTALTTNITSALHKMQNQGLLGHLQRKWWIEASQCKKGFLHVTAHGTLYSLSGLVCLLLVGFVVLLILFGIQFSRRIQDKESRRHQLTFEDMNLDNTLPAPHPELLTQPPPVLNVPEIEQMTLSQTSGSENFNEFFDRMKGGQ